MAWKRKLLERFYANIEELSNGCHIWKGPVTQGGYGQIMTNSYLETIISVHVFAWILYYKRLPKGDLHHKCPLKRCCNPEHLEELTRSEHTRRHWNDRKQNYLRI